MRSSEGRGSIALLRVLFALLTIATPLLASDAPVTIGSKNFAESRLLAEIAAQLIEARTDHDVERRFGLAGTQICFEALRTGAIDLYPEYTGTGLVSLLGESSDGDPTSALRRVRSEFLARWEIYWLAPLGFENAYEIAVPLRVAEKYGLSKISDLAAVSSELRAGLGFEFVGRPDGLPGLQSTYNLSFADVIPMQQALKFQAVINDEIDVLDVYTTDGRLLQYALRVLEDDLDFFPPYEAAWTVREEALDRYRGLGETLGLLSGAFDAERMRQLNYRLQEGTESEAEVARDVLLELGLVDRLPEEAAALSETMTDSHPSRSLLAGLGGRTIRHLGLCLAALALGVLVAVPLALWLVRSPRWAEAVIRGVGTTQTVPSIALLAFFVPILGIGIVPALVALWIYSIFPILRSAYTGLRDANPQAIEAASAMGMTPRQVLLSIRLPLAAPILMAGIRTAAVLCVGTATLAAFIGAGGLGEPIVTGLQLADPGLILAGALPAAGLALAVDALLALLERAVAPRFKS